MLQVHKLLQNSALEIRLQDSPDKVWSAMKIGQEKDAERRKTLELKVKQFKEVAAELSNPATAAPA